MPRTYPPKRTLTAVRLSPAGLAEIDKLAEAEGRTRSATIRLLLREALAARALKRPRGHREFTRSL